MPTITQLPTSSTTTAADIIPVSQNGSTCAVSLGTLLARTQSVIEIDSSSLLGRTSIGAGSPEQVEVGSGLSLSSGTLTATGLDHALFPARAALATTDNVVLSSENGPSLLPVTALRGLFRPGANISISALGVIAAEINGTGGSGNEISQLDIVSSISADDLVAVSQAGVTYATKVANLLNGTSIGQTAAASTPSDNDTFLVAQGSETLVRQSIGSVASWLTQRIKGSAPDYVMVSTNITLNPELHNNKILVCTTGINISLPVTIASNFRCEAINLSMGDVSLASAIRTSSGTQILPAGQSMRLFGFQHSGASTFYASISGAAQDGSSASTPGQPSLLSVSATSANSAQLTWTGPASTVPLTYTVCHRQSGIATWTTSNTGTASLQYAVANLTAGASYEFAVSASTSSAVGPLSNVVTLVMPTSGPAPVSVPLALNTTALTASAAVLRWSAPNSGQAQSYTVEYRPTGASAWTSVATTGTVLSTSLSGLLSGQSYEWRVTAVGASGSTAVSASASFTTSSAAPTVSGITWNMVPAGPFSKGVGAIGVNARVSPATAAVQYGVSSSLTVQPSAWVAATYVNSDLWGAYLPTPSVAGNYYMWAQGMDGSASTVSAQVIAVT